MDRRAFIAGTLTLLAAPLMAGAQQATRVYRVGLVSLGSGSTRHGMWQSFLEAMRELDYVASSRSCSSISRTARSIQRLACGGT